MTVRLAVAGTPVISEQQAARLLQGDLKASSERERVAVAFADVLMTQPDQLSDTLAAELRQLFTDTQLAELTVKILKFNLQKVTVACGHDITVTAEALTKQGWAADGSFVAAPSPA